MVGEPSLGGFGCVVSVLLEDQSYPVGMNKARVLLLAQKRALKGDSDKDECLSDIE